MKKLAKKQLNLSTEVVRALDDKKLERVAGANSGVATCQCVPGPTSANMQSCGGYCSGLM